MVAFTLQALQARPRKPSSMMDALSMSRWNVEYEDVLKSIPAKELEVDVSEAHPSPHAALLRTSPIRLRPPLQPPRLLSCTEKDLTEEARSEGDNLDQESPSRLQRSSSARSGGAVGGKRKGREKGEWKGK